MVFDRRGGGGRGGNILAAREVGDDDKDGSEEKSDLEVLDRGGRGKSYLSIFMVSG